MAKKFLVNGNKYYTGFEYGIYIRSLDGFRLKNGGFVLRCQTIYADWNVK